MPTVHTLQFNQKHSKNYTDVELARREETAEPFRLFQFLGGAGGEVSLIGEYAPQWYTVFRKAEMATGSDDPIVIDNWVDEQIKVIMGLENQAVAAQSDVVSTPRVTLEED